MGRREPVVRSKNVDQPGVEFPSRWLLLFAVAYAVMHHVGTVLSGAGSVGPTRWADWVDIATPYLVLLPAVATLKAAAVAPRSWWLLVIGGVTYVEGHGIHLAANSVANEAPGETAHVWDEVVGHYLWYAGFALVVVALAGELVHRSGPRWPGSVLALLVGITHATNSLEGGTVLFGLATAAGFSAWGLRHRSGSGTLLLWSYGASIAMMIAYGIWQGGFPQPSQVGIP